jgi:predicted ATPase with chaperone activity
VSTPSIFKDEHYQAAGSDSEADASGHFSLSGLAQSLNAGVSSLGKEMESDVQTVVPPVAETIDETGLSPSIIEQLILKILYYRGELVGKDLATLIGLKFSVIEPIVDALKWQHLLAVKKSLGMGSISAIFILSEAGRNAARDYLNTNQYCGTAPVPLKQYADLVKRQRMPKNRITSEKLRDVYRNLVVSPEVIAKIGPAVNSGKSFLIYGQPGNGKTALAECLGQINSAPIFIPYAIECQGHIIQVYDPIYHHKIAEEEESLFMSSGPKYDERWFRSPRPFITSGGELTLDMLDLSYNATSKIYEAPFQMKANNGIYLIDDFGRQRATPAEVLNRWIVPMERSIDFLSFRTGGKMLIPFEAFLVFSTNLKPEQLGDEAFLRRIQYKMLVRSPDVAEFKEIFVRFCSGKELPMDERMVDYLIEHHYRPARRPFRRCQPRDILTHAIDLINFEHRDWELTEELLEHSFGSCFTSEEGFEE